MKLRCIKMLTSMGLLAALCLSSTQASAFIAGARGTGMATTGIAYPQDAYAGAYNPAGIVDVCDRIDAQAFWLQDRGHATIHGNTASFAPLPIQDPVINGRYNAFRTENTYAGDGAINKTFCTEFCGDCWNWAIGFVGYNRNYQKTTYNKNFPLFGTSHLGLEYLNETFAPVIAVRINECHSIGISIDIQGQRLKVNGLETVRFNPLSALNPLPFVDVRPTLSSDPNHLTNKGYSYAWGVGVTLGWKWQVTDCFAFGAKYSPKTHMARFKKYSGFLAGRGRLDIPEKLGAGIAWNWIPCSTVAFDVEWVNWRPVRALHNPLLHNGTLELLGTKHGPGFGFRNQIYYKAGIDYAWNDCLTFRAGYRYARTPIRKTQTAVNILTVDTIESFVSVGATYAYCNFEVSAFYGHGFSKKVKGKNSIPPGSILRGGFGGGEADLVESGKDAAGLQIGYLF